VQTLVVVPTFNEIENAEALIEAVLRASEAHDVLVVDDASPDGTGDLVARLATASGGRVALLRRPERLGLGSAYRDGLAQGLASGRHGALFVMDCDFSHDPSAIPGLAGRLASCDLVVGSRYVAGGRIAAWGPHRRLLSRAANAAARSLLAIPVRDCTSGFMGFRREALLRVDLPAGEAEGYAAPIELKWLAVRAGLSIVEAPITFRDRERGRSKLDASHAIGAARGILAIRRRAAAVARATGGPPSAREPGTPRPSPPGLPPRP
jgi:dolichol-phosphate mannosyltransferase